MKLNILQELPGGFFETKAENILNVFSGPTLIHLNKGTSCLGPLFISVLLHGNEHSGYYALQKLLRKNSTRELILFFANPQAAASNTRFLEGQIDFNRVWSGGENPQAFIAKEVLDYCKKVKPFLSIDIHNNSGKNPFYSCINRTDEEFLSLAQFFSPYIVYFTEPHEVQSMAFSKFCPAITIEAGQSGEKEGINILEAKLLEVCSWERIPRLVSKPAIFHTVARFRIPANISYNFEADNLECDDLSLKGDIEDYNFRKLPVGFCLGKSRENLGLWLEGDCGTNIFDEYLDFSSGLLTVKKPFTPAMFTTNKDVIAKDCFGYLMEEWQGPTP